MAETVIDTIPQNEDIIDDTVIKTNAIQSKMKSIKPEIDLCQGKIQAQKRIIDTLHKELKKLADTANQLRTDQTDYLRERDGYRAKLDEITNEINNLEAQKAKLLIEMNESIKQNRDQKVKLQSLKKSLEFQNEEEIENQIKALERVMISRNLSVPEENKIITRIKQLKSIKPLATKYNKMEENANNQASMLPCKTVFEQVKEQIRKAQEKKRKVHEQLQTLIENNKKVTAPIREIAEQRDKIRRKIAEHKAIEIDLMTELNIKQKEYNATIAQKYKENQGKKREERRRRELEFEKNRLMEELEELEDDSKSSEHILLEQTIAYVKRLINPNEEQKDIQKEKIETNVMSQIPMQENIPDMTLYIKSKEEDYYCKPTIKKKSEKRKKHTQSLHQPPVHSISTLASFAKLGIDPPLSYEQYSSCLEQLEKRLDEVSNKSKQDLENIESKKKEILAQLEEIQTTLASP